MTISTGCSSRAARLLAAASAVVLLSACAVSPEPMTQAEFKQAAKSDLKAMFEGQEALTKPLTLEDALARVLKYNLDRRAKMMEETLALGQLDLSRYDLLPKLAANAGYTGRSEPNATKSRNLHSQTTSSTSEPTYSADRDAITADLGLTWNILDFGASYYSAKQNANRALIAAERRRKTVANLAQEVRFSFWRAAAAQALKDKVVATIVLAEKALADAERVESERLRNPTESLRTQKTLLESIRQLEAIDQELTSAKAELAALINVAPGSDFRLAVPASDTMPIPGWTMPLEAMEEAALENNPDVREQDYQGRITADETRKEILKLLPGINFSLSRQYDHNSFLMENRWYEAGAKISWNLLNLLSAPDRMDAADKAEQVATAKRLALRMAVLAQVHVVSHQFKSAARQFERADKLWKIETRLAETSGAQQQGGTANEIERVATETSAIAAELRRYQTYAQMQSAFGKLQATIGHDPLPAVVAGHDIETLSGSIAQPAPAQQETAQSPAPPAEEPKSLFQTIGDWLSQATQSSPPPDQTARRQDQTVAPEWSMVVARTVDPHPDAMRDHIRTLVAEQEP